jgi:hypothetical protein
MAIYVLSTNSHIRNHFIKIGKTTLSRKELLNDYKRSNPDTPKLLGWWSSHCIKDIEDHLLKEKYYNIRTIRHGIDKNGKKYSRKTEWVKGNLREIWLYCEQIVLYFNSICMDVDFQNGRDYINCRYYCKYYNCNHSNAYLKEIKKHEATHVTSYV